ncbi:response regulator transcription factor [Actinoplanes sp. CA-252034]|uniref:response regulator transcription factor n=1 Tax=Actinoplanes sp. CA-252034 TaxID=3239906 RepID=UPI003D98C010
MLALAVEPDAIQAERLLGYVGGLGYQVRAVATGKDALHAFEDCDLVLLSLDLPDIDGHEVCRDIRKAGDTPVIAFAGGNGAEGDRVLGLQAGADDCMARPYGLREVAARIDAVMRRARRTAAEPEVVTRGELRVDAVRHEVGIGDRVIPLTRKEFELIRVLASEPDRVFSRQELMARIWQDDGGAPSRAARSSRTLDTHVGTVRHKIGSGGWIVTVRGVGFRLGDGRTGTRSR